MNKVPKFLTYNDNKYEFLRARNNVLVYINQPTYYYDDWTEDGKILIVQFYPERTEGNAFEVLHELNIGYSSGYITDIDISKQNRMAKSYKEEK